MQSIAIKNDLFNEKISFMRCFNDILMKFKFNSIREVNKKEFSPKNDFFLISEKSETEYFFLADRVEVIEDIVYLFFQGEPNSCRQFIHLDNISNVKNISIPKIV